MNRRKEITDELKSAAPTLAGTDIQQPYEVPSGYFDSLAENMLLRIKLENAANPQEELELIAPALSGVSKNMPFSLPAGYFDTLTPGIKVAEPVEKKLARVVKMFQPQRTFRIAAAAVTVGIIGIAAWLFMREPNAEYAVKSDTELQTELKSRVGEISENELADFLAGSTVLTSFDNTYLDEISEDDVKLMLADIPDQALEMYVDQHAVKEKFN